MPDEYDEMTPAEECAIEKRMDEIEDEDKRSSTEDVAEELAIDLDAEIAADRAEMLDDAENLEDVDALLNDLSDED
jgi:hypothetical protein